MAQYPVPAVGQRFTAEFVSSMLPFTVRKAGTTSRISTTALTADPDITLAVEANAQYDFSSLLLYDGAGSGASGADFKWAFTGPAGISGNYWISLLDTAAATTATDLNTFVSITSTGTAGAFAVGSPTAIMMTGVFQTSGTAGSLTLTWAQNVSTASNTTLRADSYLKITRIG